MEHLKEILAGLGGFLVAIAIIVACFAVAHDNANKVRDLTRTCISQGYSGWSEDRGCFR